MINVNELRHGKEKIYYGLSAIVGALFWFLMLIDYPVEIITALILLLIVLWINQQYFKAFVWGNAIHVNDSQYKELNEIVIQQAQELQLKRVPDVFILNGQGMVNAMAVRFLSGRFILLYSDLVDLMLKRNEMDELKMIIGHELGHHAAGHVLFLKRLLIYPVFFFPIVAYSWGRACELTADRIGMALTNNKEASIKALASIACGSQSLSSSLNIENFKLQEKKIPGLFGFLYELYSTHPRTTKRIISLDKYFESVH